MDIIDNADHAMAVDEDETRQPLTFDRLYATMQETRGLSHNIDLNTAITFIQAAYALKKAIVHEQLPTSDPSTPPPALPAAISHFLADLLGLSHAYITGLWSTFRGVVWHHGESLWTFDIVSRVLREPTARREVCEYLA